MTEGEYASLLTPSPRAEYLYTRQCKRALQPRLTWQYALDWWGRVCPRQQDGSTQPGTAASDETGATTSSVAPTIPASTTILGLTPPPRRPRGRGTRIALLLSTGHRFLLPLLPAPSSRQTHTSCGTCYWSTATRVSDTAVSAASAVDVRLVLGSLDAITTLAGVPTHSAPSRTKSSELNFGRTATDEVLQYTFASVPYKVLWLSAVPDRLLVSLPCEERLATFATQPDTGSSTIVDVDCTLPSSSAPPRRGETRRRAEQQESGVRCVEGTSLHSFALPRGVVPLDLAEVGDGHFVAVGTIEHGVLLCSIALGGGARGAVRAVCRAVGLSGFGAALFPITRLAALFPRHVQTMRARRAGQRSPHDEGEDKCDVDAMTQLWHGALICSCPYEAQSVLIKLSDGGEGVIEDMSGVAGPEAVLHVSSFAEADGSLLLCTSAHKILELRVIPPGASKSRNDNDDDDDDDDEDAGATVERSSKARLTRFDRVAPTIVQRRLLRLEQPVLRVLDGEPVYQGKTYSSNYVPSYKFTKHWTLCVDADNVVHLLDRGPTLYTTHSSHRLVAMAPPSPTKGTSVRGRAQNAMSGKRGRPRKGSKRRTRAHSSSSSSSSLTECEDEPRGRRRGASRQGSSARDGGSRSANARTAEGGDALEDLVTGLAFLAAGDGWLQAVVTHHRNRISVITWQSSSSS